MNVIVKFGIVAGLLLLTVGCAAPVKPAAREVPFDESEYLKYAGSGTATVEGQGFAKTRSGDVKYAAGNTVVLAPLTRYGEEFWSRAVMGGTPLEPADPRGAKYLRHTIADGEGRFRFERIPAGDYYVLTGVNWEVPINQYRTAMQRVIVADKVSVGSGEKRNVVLQPRPLATHLFVSQP